MFGDHAAGHSPAPYANAGDIAPISDPSARSTGSGCVFHVVASSNGESAAYKFTERAPQPADQWLYMFTCASSTKLLDSAAIGQRTSDHSTTPGDTDPACNSVEPPYAPSGLSDRTYVSTPPESSVVKCHDGSIVTGNRRSGAFNHSSATDTPTRTSPPPAESSRRTSTGARPRDPRVPTPVPNPTRLPTRTRTRRHLTRHPRTPPVQTPGVQRHPQGLRYRRHSRPHQTPLTARGNPSHPSLSPLPTSPVQARDPNRNATSSPRPHLPTPTPPSWRITNRPFGDVTATPPEEVPVSATPRGPATGTQTPSPPATRDRSTGRQAPAPSLTCTGCA